MNYTHYSNPLAPRAPGNFQSMAQIKEANRRLGHHFFDADTMRFFRSKIAAGPFKGRYFITSEQFVPSQGEPHPRMYTVKIAYDDGSIDTIGEFQRYATLKAAKAAIP